MSTRTCARIAILSLVTIVIFTIKGAATYGHTVILSQIGNAILANNQRRLFAKLMSENSRSSPSGIPRNFWRG